jgi:hypothetical protein
MAAGMSGRNRGDTPSRALARIIAVVDVIHDELHPAVAEAIAMGRRALEARDGVYEKRVLVVAADPSEAAEWVAQHAREGGAQCTVVFDAADIAVSPVPLTVVALGDAESRDDWPRIAAEIAVLGADVDVIREYGRSRA